MLHFTDSTTKLITHTDIKELNFLVILPNFIYAHQIFLLYSDSTTILVKQISYFIHLHALHVETQNSHAVASLH